MKVAFFLGTLNRGGAETLLADVFNHSEPLPFDAVCLYRKEGSLSMDFHRSEVRMLCLPRKGSWMIYGLRIRRLMRSEKVDIVHAQSALNAFLAAVFLAFTGIRVVVTFHSYGSGKNNPLIKRVVSRYCRRIVFVSEAQRKWLLNHGYQHSANKSVVIHNGIDFSRLQMASPIADDAPLKMCMVGSFGSGRNQLFICKFLDELKTKGVKFQFYFIGAPRDSEPQCYQDCVDYCRHHQLDGCVSFCGLCDNVPQQLSTMDCFIYATRHDTFGIAVLEAIASGLPTFVNSNPVMREITGQGQFANLYHGGDIGDMLARFEDYLIHRQEYISRARENAFAIRQQFGISNHISQLQLLYLSVLTDNKN